MGNIDHKAQEKALILLDKWNGDLDSFPDIIESDEILMEAYLEGLSTKEEIRNFIMNYSVSNNTSCCSSVSGEHRMRCNTCGHIFCYTDDDLRQNKSHQNWAKAHAIASLFGSSLDMYGQQSQMDKELDKVIDYSRCPSCRSQNVIEIEAEAVQLMQSTSSPAVSSADEIKKYKELLDCGIITQEEFDAKKKQLLGL